MSATQPEARKLHPQLLEWEDGQQADAYTHEGDLIVLGETGQADPGQDTIIVNTENGGEYFIRSGQVFDVNETEAKGEAKSVRLADLTNPLGSIAIGGSLKIPHLTPGVKVRSVVVRRAEPIQTLAVTPVAGNNPFSRTDRRLYQALNPETPATPPRQKATPPKPNRAQPKQKAPPKARPRRPKVNPVKAGGVRYRTEHSRSVEDAAKFKALEKLKRLGVLQSAADHETIHGRAARIGEGSWSVDPHRRGSVDNVFTRSSLYVASQRTAREFAQARVKQMMRRGISEAEAKLYIVTSSDADAAIIDGISNHAHPTRFKTQEYRDAIDALLPEALWGTPAGFDDRAIAPGVYATLMRHFDAQYADKGSRTRLTSQDIATAAAETGAAKSLVTTIAGNINARTLIKANLDDAADAYLRSGEDVVDDSNSPFETPLSLEYIGKFMRDAHIVGYRTDVRSGTLGKHVEIMALFDTQKVNARVRYNEARARATYELLPVAAALHADFEPKQVGGRDLLSVLQNPHASPQRIMTAAGRVGRFGREFADSAGNWEGYTLGEHTESALRNFEENYADKLPVELLAPIRTAVLTHDIGKAAATRANRKSQQKDYNLRMAQEFYDELKLPDSAKKFLTSMIGDGMSLAGDALIQGRAGSRTELRNHARRALAGLMKGRDNVTGDMVDGYVDLCEALVVCDGGSYTSMGVTRSEKYGYHRNAASFDKSFRTPVGPGKRDLKLRRSGQLRARK